MTQHLCRHKQYAEAVATWSSIGTNPNPGGSGYLICFRCCHSRVWRSTVRILPSSQHKAVIATFPERPAFSHYIPCLSRRIYSCPRSRYCTTSGYSIDLMALRTVSREPHLVRTYLVLLSGHIRWCLNPFLTARTGPNAFEICVRRFLQ